MRLVYLVQYFFPEKASGLQLVDDLLEGFAKHGWKVDVFTPSPTRGITDEQRKEYTQKRVESKYAGNLTIHRMHLYREGKNILGRAIRYVLFSMECFWKSVTVPADFIFTGSGPPTQGLVAGLAKKLSGKKVIYNLQDIFPDSLVTAGICAEKSWLMKIGRVIENFTYKNADHIITITDDMKMNLIKKGIPEEKISVVRNWIDTNKVSHVKRDDNSLFDELNLPRNKFYVVYAGNLGKVQGVDILVSVAEFMKNVENIQFVIFGNGSEESYLRQLVAQKKLKNIFMFSLMPIERVSEVYSLADVSVIPCKAGVGNSGMPSKTWTIMAAGVPIIASFDTDSEMAQLVREVECGSCVPAGDIEMLAESIMKMYDDPSIVARMGENGRKYVEKNMTKAYAVEKYIQAIEKITNERIR